MALVVVVVVVVVLVQESSEDVFIFYSKKYEGIIFNQGGLEATDKTVLAWSEPKALRDEVPFPKLHVPFNAKKGCPLVTR